MARISTIGQKLGLRISTPLLVPSFSTKGFKFNTEGQSETTNIINLMSDWLTESMLVSAHDIYYKYIPEEISTVTELLFIDSGGYEKLIDDDFSSVFFAGASVHEWNENYLRKVYDQWSNLTSCVLVSYDNKKTVKEQIESAKELFKSYPNSLHTILLKREREENLYINIDSVMSNIQYLTNFDIIGLTEKELGNSILTRMHNIALIRQELDKQDINKPIHIFGSLDPVTSPLYFLAGAEIFDGLTWLRYSYFNGIAVYQHNHGAIKTGISIRDDRVRSQSFAENISYLEELKLQMKSYVINNGDFTKFKFHSDFFRTSYDSLCTKLGVLA
ncbi:hypothetical protein [Anabaena azotica]|uniref:Uncharacterized protein n=1 Tax=Anabaena azotica FACHB-119 TaxID=947527 RepID=A0ABR8D404_9NOST|nr:hypothetical protein [Anabaena azotica]MBD2501888.1 hypothetical protein [Anabaena azotica FACHB-119]